jgi:hypothetical protein
MNTILNLVHTIWLLANLVIFYIFFHQDKKYGLNKSHIKQYNLTLKVQTLKTNITCQT